jgi:hypothetical protein
MFCDRCGTKLSEGQAFCPSCGKAIGAGPPLMPSRSRIAGHVRLLGIFWLADGAIHLFPGFFLLAFFHNGMFPFYTRGIPGFVFGLVHLIGLALIAGSALALLAGWGLLDRQPWARMLAIVLGVLNLLNVPFGTALGIYTLWVLLSAESEEEYRRLARVA